MEYFIAFLLGMFTMLSIDSYFWFNDSKSIELFPKCIEKQFGKETIKKCYDVVEVKNE